MGLKSNYLGIMHNIGKTRLDEKRNGERENALESRQNGIEKFKTETQNLYCSVGVKAKTGQVNQGTQLL